MALEKKPTPPQGDGPLEVWIRTVLLPFVYSLQLTSIVGGRKQQNPSGGYSLVLGEDKAAGTPPAATPAVPFIVTAVSFTGHPTVGNNGNVMLCKALTGGVESGTAATAITYVYRSYKLRPIQQRFINGSLWTYIYGADYSTRVASASGKASENQGITPPFIFPYGANGAIGQTAYAGDIIYAEKLSAPIAYVNTGTASAPVLVGVEYIDTNRDGRAWGQEVS